jgi:hypothetical protein
MTRKYGQQIPIMVSALLLGFLTVKAATPAESGAAEDAPDQWKTHTWVGKCDYIYAPIGHTGTRSIQIASTAGTDAMWHQRRVIQRCLAATLQARSPLLETRITETHYTV